MTTIKSTPGCNKKPWFSLVLFSICFSLKVIPHLIPRGPSQAIYFAGRIHQERRPKERRRVPGGWDLLLFLRRRGRTGCCLDHGMVATAMGVSMVRGGGGHGGESARARGAGRTPCQLWLVWSDCDSTGNGMARMKLEYLFFIVGVWLLLLFVCLLVWGL